MKNSSYFNIDMGSKCRFIFVLCCFIVMCVNTNTLYAKKSPLNMDVSQKLENRTVKDIFDFVESNSQYIFIYGSDVLTLLDAEVSIDTSGMGMVDIIREVASRAKLEYSINERQVNLYAKAPQQAVAKAKTIKITGQVFDDNKEAIAGANVIIKGEPSIGTITDVDGMFDLNAPEGSTVLISFIGFVPYEVKVSSQKLLIVELKSDSKLLDEVVVIGAGTQKKVSVTGSITSVKGASLKMPSSSLTNAFAGQLAGVISMTKSGAPGSSSEFYIRGISTFGGRATPLIMLDDVEISTADLNNIPPETIESFSILKDASATAIYGSRGANGVMLIKTKNGEANERTKINVTLEQSFNRPMNFPSFVDGATWMELYNEALISRTPNAIPKYSEEVINNTRNRVNPYVYPDVNWKDVIFKNVAYNQRANVNIQGGGSKATYYMSIQATHDTGLLNSKKVYSWNNNINNWGYNFQNNISYKLTSTTQVDLRMNAQIRQLEGGNYSPDNLFAKMQSSNPINFPVTFPYQEGDKHIRFGSSVLTGNNYRENIYASMLNSYKETRENTINTSLKIRQDFDFITKGLSTSLLVNFKNWASNSYNRTIEPYLYRVKDGSYNADNQSYEIERLGTSGTDYISQSDITKMGDQTFFLQGTIDYNRTFGSHSIGGMLLYTQREYKNVVLPRRNQGVSGRFMYNFSNKYFAELNFGYTGTERLSSGERFEFFPAMSLGWVMSDEAFFKPLKHVISFLKVRGSYGLIGSDETGSNAGAEHFLYIDKVKLESDGYGFTTGEDLNITMKGPQMINYAVRGARWEKVKKFNIGVDLELFDDLNITADYFRDRRYDILLKREAWPQSLGYHEAKPWANKGRVNNWGVEFSANYNKYLLKDLALELRGTFTYTQNKLVDGDDPIYEYPWQSSTGKPLSRIEGYIAEGLFKSQEEIDRSPDQSGLGSVPKPGDIKYRDITGDGIIDNNDRTMISDYGSVPRIQYGFGASLRWRKFDIGVFFNGSAKRKIMTGLMAPFGQADNNVFKFIADNRWSEKNPDPNAKYPRLGLQGSETQNNNHASTYWMRSGNFLRFKMLEFGYSFKYGRAYLSGNNLAVFGPFKQWDPELNWNSYPLQRVFNIGLQLNF